MDNNGSELNMQDNEIVTFSRLALSLANDYESIYYINAKTDAYTEFGAADSESGLTILSSGPDFYKDMTYNVPRLVYPEDRETFMQTLKKENLLSQLHDGKSFSLGYRLILDNRIVYYQLKAIRGTGYDSEHIILGVKNVDEQVRREMIAAAESRVYGEISMALASRYEVIYYIDTQTNHYTQYSSSDEYAKLGVSTQGDDFFATAKEDIRAIVDPEDCDRIIKAIDKNNLLSLLRQTGTASFTYRQMLNGRSQYVTMNVVRPKNDSHRIVIGVLNVDAQMRREQAALQESETYSHIINALAKRYEVIYYVDLDTGYYQEFSSSKKYSKLKVGAAGMDFFGDTQRNMKRDIYPEDYPIMARAMDREQFISDLAQTGSTSITYRLMLDGRPQYVTLFAIRPIEDNNHVIVAVSNIDAAKQREMEFRAALGNAMDMANRDALTRVKNKHAYTQAVRELEGDIENNKVSGFAVAVLDINGLKAVNDTKGHHAGDEYIKASCHIICSVFKRSPVFRVGGDEFVVLLTGEDFKNRQRLSEEFSRIILNNKKKGLATLAFGIADFDSTADKNVESVFERADKAMYENKKLFKNSCSSAQHSV